ncbi:putative bifunctional diguanylate cyclase/phosphodiesterase [Vibrio sp.]|uniref:putative bifunctional diguanylate cyclase/phosphodiesterase n=1 Tax=Vibrio sp. TaxID=678 RepID=UPI003AA935BF
MNKHSHLLVFSSNIVTLLAINVCIASILVMTNVYGPHVTNGKIYWLLLVYVITGIRCWVHYGISNDNKYKLDFHFIGVTISAIIWAAYPYIFHQTMTLEEVMFTLVIFCGMSGGSVTLLSVDRRSALVYVSLTIFPYSLILLTGDDVTLRNFGVMGIVYGIALCLTAIRSANFVYSSIDNQTKIESLVSSLESEVDSRTSRILTLERRDMLSGLYNRNNFAPAIAIKRIHKNNPALLNSFIHVDIENLHLINDNYGHEYGDFIISEVGKILLNNDKLHGSISARYGSDEFIIHTYVLSKVELEQFISDLKKQITVYFQSGSIRVKPDYHIGYYICDDSVPINTAIRNAYLAVSHGKRNNLRVSCFGKNIQESYERKEYLCEAIKKAIHDDSFYMQYQPIASVRDDKIHSFEALVRWDLKGKRVSPDEFIKVAEEYGLIIDLGRLVLKMSIEALSVVNKMHPYISISINVSVIQFEDETFLDSLKLFISQYSVNPNNVHLEITETAMITNIEKLTQSILSAKEIGVMISVDDFGTGFSSISVLRNLKIDYIKIDKSYIDNICLHEKEQSIVSAVTKMAHTIGTKVIAEGIESQEQLNSIAQNDIDFYQGYLYSKPVSYKEMLSYCQDPQKQASDSVLSWTSSPYTS